MEQISNPIENSEEQLRLRSSLKGYETKLTIDSYTIISYGFQEALGISEGFYSLISTAFFKSFRGAKKDLTVLDLGCGVGRFMFELADQYPHAKFFGLDHSFAMIERAREMLNLGKKIEIKRSAQSLFFQGKKLSNVYLEQGDARKLPYPDESFDCINATNLLDRVPDAAIVITEMMRVLKSDGFVILTSPLNFDGFENSKPYTTDELIRLLRSKGLKVVQYMDRVPYQEFKDFRSMSNWSSFFLWGKKQNSKITFCDPEAISISEQAVTYKAIFEGKPWGEKWPLEEAEKAIRKLRDFPAFEGELVMDDSKCVGLWFGYTLRGNERFMPIADLELVKNHGANIFYLAEFGIIPSMQFQGLGIKMMKQVEGRHNVMVTRTINPLMVDLLKKVFNNVEKIAYDFIDPGYDNRYWYLCS